MPARELRPTQLRGSGDVVKALGRERRRQASPLFLRYGIQLCHQEMARKHRRTSSLHRAIPVDGCHSETLKTAPALTSKTKVYPMYGLTEAFRSTFLPPEEVEQRPDSIGKAIPNAEILVLRPDGTRASPTSQGNSYIVARSSRWATERR